VLIAIGIALAVVAGLAVLGAVIGDPGEPKTDCKSRNACPGPPPLPQQPLLVTGDAFRSSELGWRVEYPGSFVKVSSSDARSVRFELPQDQAVMTIEGAPRAEASPRQLFDRELDELRDRGLGVSEDTEPGHEIFGPELAFHDGVGGAYTAVVDSPAGPGDPFWVNILAAGDRDTSLVATVLLRQFDEDKRKDMLGVADILLDTLRTRGAPG
jgi:hypothetical protein